MLPLFDLLLTWHHDKICQIIILNLSVVYIKLLDVMMLAHIVVMVVWDNMQRESELCVKLYH